MNRNKSDADVEGVVRYINYASQEIDIVQRTRDWSSADFEYACDRYAIGAPGERELPALREIWSRLRSERRREELGLEQLTDIKGELDKLKNPHWSVVPIFWMTVIILILTAVAALRS